jgi:hypothetical protein
MYVKRDFDTQTKALIDEFMPHSLPEECDCEIDQAELQSTIIEECKNDAESLTKTIEGLNSRLREIVRDELLAWSAKLKAV